MYIVDFKKTGHELLLGLVNFDNKDNPNWVPIKPEEVILVQPPEPQPKGSAKNTKTIIRTKSDEFDIRDVEVFYNRIDISYLFSAVGLFVQQVGLDTDPETGIVINDKFFAEINRKYGLNFGADDFTLYRDGTRVVVRAKEESLAYIKEQDVNVIPSLAARVANTALDGFFMVSHENQWIISRSEAYPANSVFVSASEVDNPQHRFGGNWVKLPVHNVTNEDAFFINHPLLYSFSLNAAPARREDNIYVLLCQGKDTTYNEGVATKEAEGWKINLPGTKYHGEVLPFGPSDSYVLVHVEAGEVNTGEPVYKWKRLD